MTKMPFSSVVAPKMGVVPTVRTVTPTKGVSSVILLRIGHGCTAPDGVTKVATHSVSAVIPAALLAAPASAAMQIPGWDAVVVPSTEPESFGLVATESMLSKKPVIASKLGGLQEIIIHEETGYLFEAGNSADLCEQLEKIIENPYLGISLGEKGQERVKKCFSTQKYVGGMKSVYDSIFLGL